MKSGNAISFDGSWERGHCIYECVNERSKELLRKCNDAMILGKNGIRLIPYADKNNAVNPRGWLWMPVPHIESKILVQLQDVLNVEEGKVEHFFFLLHFLLKINRGYTHPTETQTEGTCLLLIFNN